jgi:hypothetical protein
MKQAYLGEAGLHYVKEASGAEGEGSSFLQERLAFPPAEDHNGNLGADLVSTWVMKERRAYRGPITS